MYRTNSNCDDCNHYYKIVWNCKKNILEKDWLYLCYNCIRLNRKLYKRYFKSQLENIDLQMIYPYFTDHAGICIKFKN